MRTASYVTAFAFVLALMAGGSVNAQTTASTTPGAPSTGYDMSVATTVTLGATALAAVLGAAYVIGRKRA